MRPTHTHSPYRIYAPPTHTPSVQPPPAAISSGMEPYLGAAISGSGGLDDAAVSERQRKVKARVLNEKPFREMHVCLATDVDVKTLRGAACPAIPSPSTLLHYLHLISSHLSLHRIHPTHTPSPRGQAVDAV